jgi:hypothetical protein
VFVIPSSEQAARAATANRARAELSRDEEEGIGGLQSEKSFQKI